MTVGAMSPVLFGFLIALVVALGIAVFGAFIWWIAGLIVDGYGAYVVVGFVGFLFALTWVLASLAYAS